MTSLSKSYIFIVLYSFAFNIHAHEYHEAEYTNEKYLNNGNIHNIHRGRKEIILTIDDGPTAGVTNKILDALKKYGVKATFFVTGKRVAGQTAIMKRMRDEGHIVGNHTFSHAKIGDLNSTQIKNEFLKSHRAVLPYSRNSTNYYFRAPGGNWKAVAAQVANATSFGYRLKGPLYWDVGGSVKISGNSVINAADWACWNRKRPATYLSVGRCLQGYINETTVKKGGVILFHDLNVKSAELIERYVKYFKSRSDYSFVTLNDANL